LQLKYGFMVSWFFFFKYHVYRYAKAAGHDCTKPVKGTGVVEEGDANGSKVRSRFLGLLIG
jgi:hypothetical protein